MSTVVIIVSLIYTLILFWVLHGIIKLPFFFLKKENCKTSFSIIIPFRNEEKHLPTLLSTLTKINYDVTKFEVFFVDDESTDASVTIIKESLKDLKINFQILANERYSNSPKKDAISLALKKANYEWIVTTDADCSVPKNWLKLLDGFIQKKDPKMVCMPVVFENNGSMIHQFQFFDGLSLQAVTLGGFGNKKPLLCNGANLAYKKNTFFEVAGFIDNDDYASGDDIFLMEKIKKMYPKKISFLKNADATVITQCVESWEEVIQQRVRWASKTKYLKNLTVNLLGGATFVSNLTFICCLLCCFIFPLKAGYFLFFIGLKLLLDTLILISEALFLRQKMNLLYLFLSSFAYSFIVVWVVLQSLRGGYEWKGRTFKN